MTADLSAFVFRGFYYDYKASLSRLMAGGEAVRGSDSVGFFRERS